MDVCWFIFLLFVDVDFDREWGDIVLFLDEFCKLYIFDILIVLWDLFVFLMEVCCICCCCWICDVWLGGWMCMFGFMVYFMFSFVSLFSLLLNLIFFWFFDFCELLECFLFVDVFFFFRIYWILDIFNFWNELFCLFNGFLVEFFRIFFLCLFVLEFLVFWYFIILWCIICFGLIFFGGGCKWCIIRFFVFDLSSEIELFSGYMKIFFLFFILEML